MSMHNYANSGYVVKVTDLMPLLSAHDRELLTKRLPEIDDEDLREFLDESLPVAFPFAGVFTLNDECETEDLEIGEKYVLFDEADLFEMTPSRFHEGLNAKGIKPKMSQWVTFG